MAIRINSHLSIDEGDITFEFARSGGPGGQNVNKVETKVTLRFDLAGSRALTESQRARIRAELSGRISREGALTVTSSRHRTQTANRREATLRFAECLAEALRPVKVRRATRPTKASQRRRREEKVQRSERKRRRVGTDRGEE